MKKHGHIWIIYQKSDDDLAQKSYQDLIELIRKESE